MFGFNAHSLRTTPRGHSRRGRPSQATWLLIALACWLFAAMVNASESQQLLGTAHAAYLAGDFQGADRLLDKLLAKGTSSGRLEMELALVDDALGRPQQARRHYDRLGRSAWRDLAALPSAANLAALGRYRDADRAFAQIASKGANADEKAYAQLWRLWLVTRDNASSRRARDTAFKRLLGAVRPDDAAQHALVELYRGKADSASVFAAIDRMPLTLPQRRALIAEATLFSGGYLQGMRNDAAAARWLYQVELGLPPVACPERPLIAQAARALPPLPTSNAR